MPGLKKKVAGALELPKEVMLNLPLISLTGNEELLIENYRGIIEYTETTARLNTACGVLRIDGRGLVLKELTSESLLITGRLAKLEFIV